MRPDPEERFPSGPPAAPQLPDPPSRYWFSDRELAPRRSSSIGYSTQDLRKELSRVEKRLYRLTFVSLIVAVLAVLAIAGLLIQTVR